MKFRYSTFLLVPILFWISCASKDDKQRRQADEVAKQTYEVSSKTPPELAFDKTIATARQNKLTFFGNFFYGMTEVEFKDSLDTQSNMIDQRLKIHIADKEIDFEILPVFNKGYLSEVVLLAVMDEIGFNPQLVPQSGEDILFKQPFFYLKYLDYLKVNSLIDLYKSKYGLIEEKRGVPEINKLNPDITKYITWLTQFNNSQKSNIENKLDSSQAYEKIISAIQETVTADTLTFKEAKKNCIIQLSFIKVQNVNKLTLLPHSLKMGYIKKLSINYNPIENIESKKELEKWQQELNKKLLRNDSNNLRPAIEII